MPIKDKDRFYLTLNHRHEKPGFHWAILLAPKDDPSSTSDQKDSTRWDVYNDDNPANDWKFRKAPVNQYLSISLCARVLLAKYDARDRKATLGAINDALKSVEVRQGDATFTCKVWVLSAIQSLEAAGLIRLNISHAAIEAKATAFGEECMEMIRSRKVDIAAGGVSAIPVLDWRRK